MMWVDALAIITVLFLVAVAIYNSNNDNDFNGITT